MTLFAIFCGTDSFHVVHVQQILALPHSCMGVRLWVIVMQPIYTSPMWCMPWHPCDVTSWCRTEQCNCLQTVQDRTVWFLQLLSVCYMYRRHVLCSSLCMKIRVKTLRNMSKSWLRTLRISGLSAFSSGTVTTAEATQQSALQQQAASCLKRNGVGHSIHSQHTWPAQFISHTIWHTSWNGRRPMSCYLICCTNFFHRRTIWHQRLDLFSQCWLLNKSFELLDGSTKFLLQLCWRL